MHRPGIWQARDVQRLELPDIASHAFGVNRGFSRGRIGVDAVSPLQHHDVMHVMNSTLRVIECDRVNRFDSRGDSG